MVPVNQRLTMDQTQRASVLVFKAPGRQRGCADAQTKSNLETPVNKSPGCWRSWPGTAGDQGSLLQSDLAGQLDSTWWRGLGPWGPVYMELLLSGPTTCRVLGSGHFLLGGSQNWYRRLNQQNSPSNRHHVFIGLMKWRLLFCLFLNTFSPPSLL